MEYLYVWILQAKKKVICFHLVVVCVSAQGTVALECKTQLLTKHSIS